MVAPSVGRGKDSLAQPSLSNKLSRSIARHLEPAIEWLVSFIIRHWLLIVNTLFFLFIALPLLAPVLEAFGFHLPARIIFLVYRPTCHQLPDRSFFILGRQVAICARCSSIYIFFWIAGIIYSFGTMIQPKRIPVWKAPPLWVVGLAAIPMALDGASQFFGFRVSTNELRTITGGLVGAVSAAFIYPFMHSGFKDARAVWEQNQQRLVVTNNYSLEDMQGITEDSL